MRSIDGNLLEGLDQFTRPVQIFNQLTSCIATGAHEFLKLRALQWRLGSQFGVECVGAPRETRSNRETDADRIVDLVRDARDQPPEHRKPFSVDQIALRRVQF